MKKIFYYFLPVLAMAVIYGCGGNKADETSFVVHGKLSNAKKDSIYLEELTVRSAIGIDSAVLSEEGEFYFKVKPKEIGFYVLKLKSNNFITLLLDKNENVEITGDVRQLQRTYNVTGSAGSTLIRELDTHRQMNLERVDSLGIVYQANKGKPDLIKVKTALDSIYKLIILDEKSYLKNYINKNTHSLSCLLAIYQQFGRELMFDNSKPEDFAYFLKLDNALYAEYPDNLHTKDLHERVSEQKKVNAEKELAESKLGIGAIAPDFTLQTAEGTDVSLSSFRGKNVLIDFWASWCNPCRKSNINLVKLYNQFKGKNFTILSVSLDKDKDPWNKAIKLDKLAWTQVSDFKVWSSPVVKLYNVNEIPYTVLIDEDGKIIAKGLHGDTLTAKVAEIVK